MMETENNFVHLTSHCCCPDAINLICCCFGSRKCIKRKTSKKISTQWCQLWARVLCLAHPVMDERGQILRHLSRKFKTFQNLYRTFYRRSFYLAANAILGRIGRIATEEVVLHLLLTKCVPILLWTWSLLNKENGLKVRLHLNGYNWIQVYPVVSTCIHRVEHVSTCIHLYRIQNVSVFACIHE